MAQAWGHLRRVRHRIRLYHVMIPVGIATLLLTLLVALSSNLSILSVACLALAGVQVTLASEAARRSDTPATPTADTAARFAADLKRRLLTGRFRTVKSFANNPKITGLSRSTVYSAFSGTRLPTEPTVLSLLTAMAGTTEAEVRTWLERRTRLADEPDRTPRPAWALAGLAVHIALPMVALAALVVAVVGMVRRPVEASVPAASACHAQS